MKYNYVQFATPQFHILSDKQLEELHLRTLEILERVGVKFECEEAIEILSDAGCNISKLDRVKIPSYLVEQALRISPKTITIYTRDGEPAFVLDGMSGSHFGASPDPRMIQDLYTGELRQCYVEDIANISRLIDALPNIEFAFSGASNLTLPRDVDDISDRIGPFQFILNSSKPLVFEPNNASSLAELIDLCSTVVGGEEQLRKKTFVCNSCEPVTPLVQGKSATEESLLCAQKGIPNIVYSMPMAGATTPAAFASCLAIANAEILSQLTVIQLKYPGAPFIYGASPSIMDMKTTIYSYGAPERVLMVGAITELAHYYRLPMYGTGGCTDAALMGIQATAESMYQIVISILTGADLVHNVGTIYHAGTRSLELIVLVNELIEMVKVLMKGIKIDNETLPIKLIEEQGPGSNYLSTSHTLRYFREFWVPTLFDRSAVKKEDAKDCEELLKERTVELLRTHKPRQLPEDLVKELKKIEKTWLDRVGLKEYPKRVE